MDIFFPRIFKGLKRGPAVIIPKDFGMIVAYSGIGKKSEVVDAGSGSGFLAIALGNIAKSVTSYEWREDFAKLSEDNVKKSGLKNVKIKNKSVFDGIEETEVDLVTLDLADSEKAVGMAFNALNGTGVLAGYLPHSEQVAKFVAECNKAGFRETRTVECIVRNYLVRESGFRPENIGLVHTAYLVFAYK
ncbi:MAG: rRNA adenine N-6-methyltransferase family protein [Candidatus Micrarchaeia archaeon]